MSKGSSGPQVQTTNSTQTVKLPQYIEDAAQKNLAASYDVSQGLLGPWTGPRVAGMTPGAEADVAALQGLAGAGSPGINLAQHTAGDLQGYNPLMVNPGSIASSDLSQYMNPYIQNVINTGLQGIDIQRKQALNDVDANAKMSKAFGGSRTGVLEGVTNAGAAKAAGDLASQLAATGYDKATGLAGQDIATNLQGQLANQGADLSGAGVRLNAATAGGNLGALGSQTTIQQIMAALQGQSLLQQNSQAQIDAARGAYGEQQQFPLQQLQIPLSALGMTPYGQTTTGSSTTTQPSPQGNGLMSGLGAGLGILGGLGSLFGSGGAFPLIGAGASLFGK